MSELANQGEVMNLQNDSDNTNAYQSAGVDIDKTDNAISNVKSTIKSTFNDSVLTNIGGFNACYDISQLVQNYKRPVMVQSIDGVGTKIKLAQELDMLENIGEDLLSACSNDIAVTGAKPVSLMDYVASDNLDPHTFERIINSLSNACKQHDVALTGGETAEMPGIYQSNQVDLVGVITGMVDHDKMINGQSIQPGDKLYGITASGLHTNGYTLARKLFADYNMDRPLTAGDSRTLGEILLAPHINYTPIIQDMVGHNERLNGIAHITGGGLIENVKRVLPQHCDAEILINSWSKAPIYEMIQRMGEITNYEAYRTMNMGIGLVIIGPQELENKLPEYLTKEVMVHTIGEVLPGEQNVQLV